jgi:hypothetical protein
MEQLLAAPPRALAAVVALNLALFCGLTTLPAFQAAHHHWIFPVLAALIALQWAATFPLKAEGARSPLLSLLAFLLTLGVVRHATILTCFDRCAFKLAAACLLAAPVFLAQASLGGAGVWTVRRCLLAGLGSGLWSLYLHATGLRLALWAMDLSFVGVAALLWLGRRRAEFILLSVGLLAGILIRESASENARILLGVFWGVAIPLAFVEKLQAWLDARPAGAPLPRPLRTALIAGAAAGIAFYVIGPTFLTTDRAQRTERLLALAPPVPVQDPATLSPLAKRLRGHVVMLAATIGERDVYQPAKQRLAKDYVAAQFQAIGYKPNVMPYHALHMGGGIKNGTTFYNVEAVLPAAPAGSAAWIVGAHYDAAPGTLGADDNASGVAVLLEAARLLKARRPERDIRFVAFGTEEPPAFGTRNMGSVHYALWAKEHGLPVHAMLSLEMLGYYNPKPGSQLYPPFLHLFYPDTGLSVGIVSDVNSRGKMSAFAKAWRRKSDFPLNASILPGPLSILALSDQLSFWDQGYPALMLSDTAFYRNPHYHQHSDAADTLDYERMAQVTEALVEALDPKP